MKPASFRIPNSKDRNAPIYLCNPRADQVLQLVDWLLAQQSYTDPKQWQAKWDLAFITTVQLRSPNSSPLKHLYSEMPNTVKQFSFWYLQVFPLIMPDLLEEGKT